MLSDCFVPFPLALATNCSCTVLLYTGYLPFSSCIYILPKIHQTYEKGFFGNYTQVSQVSETYNGPRHEFVGYYAIKSGTTYKLNTTAKVTRNGVTETVSTDFEKRC